MSKGSRNGRVTITDVAKRSGVSTATAARALGDYGSVGGGTRDRVRTVAAELGYRPNRLARSMIKGTTQTLGVVLADIENPFFYRALAGMTDTARRRGFDVVLVNTDEDDALEDQALSTLVERQVDGLIICPTNDGDSTYLKQVVASELPVVLLDRPRPDVATDMVGLDNIGAAAEATRHLLAHGHTRIAIVTGGNPSVLPRLRRTGMKGVEKIAVTTLGDRAAGYRDALVAAGVPLRPEYLSAGGFHRDDAAAATKELMALPEPPTAVLAFDSVLSLGVLVGLRDLGLRCPDDVSVVGFDDADWAEVVSPPLTVFSQPVYEIGVKACELLLDGVEGQQRDPAEHRLQGRLIERASVGAPRPAAP